LFAPVGARLSKGLTPGEFGPPAEAFVTLPVALPEVAEDGIYGDVMYIDSFGNAITNIKGADLRLLAGHYVAEVNNSIILPVKYYAMSGESSLCCLVNSSGYLELFVNKGNAAVKYGIKKGDKVIVRKL